MSGTSLTEPEVRAVFRGHWAAIERKVFDHFEKELEILDCDVMGSVTGITNPVCLRASKATVYKDWNNFAIECTFLFEGYTELFWLTITDIEGSKILEWHQDGSTYGVLEYFCPDDFVRFKLSCL